MSIDANRDEQSEPWVLRKKDGATWLKPGLKFHELGSCPRCGYKLEKPEENQHEPNDVEDNTCQAGRPKVSCVVPTRVIGGWLSVNRYIRMINPFAKTKKEDSS